MSQHRVEQVKCVGIKHQRYILNVQCSSETKDFYVGRTATQISEFRGKLAEECKKPKEAVVIPDFKSVKWYESNKDEKKKKAVEEFCQQILQLPENVKDSETVIQFFTSFPADSEDGACSRKHSTKVHPEPTVPGSPGASALPSMPASPCAAIFCSPASPALRTSVAADGCHYEDISSFSPDITTISTPANSNNASAGVEQMYAEVFKASNAAAQPTLPGDSTSENHHLHDLDGGAYAEIPASTIPTETQTPSVPAKLLVSDMSPTHCVMPHNSNLEIQDKNSAKTVPLTPIPPMPLMASPTLSSPKDAPEEYESIGDSSEVQVIAVADFSSSTDSILSFNKGDLATLVIQSDTQWWCVKLSCSHGWVPADYWRILNPDADCTSLSLNTKSSAPWFVGKLSRSECEELLMLHGKEQHFVVRESTNLVGHYALSVKYNDRVHHFPIELTADQRYYIGKHHFKTVNNVITYYKKNALFYNDRGEGVTLGSPLVIIKH